MNLILIFLSLFVQLSDNKVILKLLHQLDIDSNNVKISFYESIISPYNESHVIGLLHFSCISDSVDCSKHFDEDINKSQTLLIEFEAETSRIVRNLKIPYSPKNYYEYALWREPIFRINDSLTKGICIDSCISVQIYNETSGVDKLDFLRIIIFKPTITTFEIVFSDNISESYHYNYRANNCLQYVERISDSLSLNQNFLIDGYHPLIVFHNKEIYISLENCKDTTITSSQIEEWTKVNGQYKMTRIIGSKAVDIWDKFGFEDNAYRALNKFRDKHGNE